MKRKKAFFRILVSYLVIMLTPMLILGYASFNFFAKFYDRELLNNRVNSLYRVQRTFDIFINQMNAYAYSLLHSSEFSTFYVNKEYGNFYDLKRKLAGVVLTGNFFNDVFYINQDLQRIFTAQTVFDYHSFRVYGPGYNIPEQETEAYLLKNSRVYWLPVQSLHQAGENMLTYVVTNKAGQARPSAAIIFQINSNTLHKLTGDALESTGACIIISDNRDGLLYSSNPQISDAAWKVWRGTKRRENGQPVEILIHSKRFIAFQSQSAVSPIKYAVLIPYQSLMAPIQSQQALFMICLVAIAVLGSLFISYFMKINYAPIHSLTKRLASLFGETPDDLSEFEAVEKALVTMADRANYLFKEKITLKLIRGGYSSLEQLEREGGKAGYSLAGPSFRAIVCSVASPAPSSLTAGAYQDLARYIESSLNSSFDAAVIEYAEDHAVYIIIAGHRDELAEIKAKLYHLKNVIESVFNVPLSIGVGGIGKIDRIKDSFAEASATSKYHLVSGAGSVHFFEEIGPEKISLLAYSNHAIDSLRHAIRHGQEERVQFAMDILIKHLSDAPNPPFAQTLAADISQTALNAMRELNPAFAGFIQNYPEMLGQGRFASTMEIIATVKMLKDELVALMVDERDAAAGSGDAVNNFKQVVQFIAEHLSEETFSVKMLADRFAMSISNFSHYFKKQTGQTVSDYIALLRFEKAKELLRATDLNLQEIASRCGYVHISTFMRQFKRREGATPASYRARFRS